MYNKRMSTAIFQQLCLELKRLARLNETFALLDWDEQCCLPPASTEARAEQKAALAALIHRESTQPRIGEWLAALETAQADLTPEQKVVVSVARKEYDKATKMPPAFIARQAAAHSRGFHAWVEARAQDDFSLFAPHLQTNLDLAREMVGYLGKSQEETYDTLIDFYDPGLTSAWIAERFAALQVGLLPLVRRIVDSPVKSRRDELRGFPEDRQETFLREVLTAVGFDFRRGRLDRSVHPFCGGCNEDTRLTTRFHPDHPLDSWSSSLHEAGHGLYQQGLPAEHIGNALGTYVGMAVHESQSRLWENQVGRGRPFWHHFEPRYRELFPTQLSGFSSSDLYLAINAVAVTPIRVDADEVTYNLHILLRFELEKLLFQGSLTVSDLPGAWNELSTRILGYTPKNNREGCLQDVHWSSGNFGYFPSYCLGNMMAAQLWYQIRQDLPDLDAQIARGEFAPLLGWLRTHIHQHGRRFDTRQLVQKVTGQDLGPACLLRYLSERYLPLYE